MSNHHYIEDLNILKGLNLLTDHAKDEGVYITEDPATYEYLTRNKRSTLVPSNYLPQSTLDLGSDFGAILTKFWVNRINNYYNGLEIGLAINTILYNYIASALYKYQCLMNLKDRGIKTKIYCYKKTGSKIVKNLSTDELLAEISSLPEFRSLFSIVFIDNYDKADKKGYSVITKFNIKNSLYYILGFLADPTKLKFHLNKKRLRKINISDIKDLNQKKKTILILSSGPQIQINSSWIDRECDVYQCDFTIRNDGNNEQYNKSLLKSYLIGDVPDHKLTEVSRELLDFLATRISAYICDFILPSHSSIQNSVGLINHPNITILNGGREIQESLFSNVMSYYKVPTIVFQEGTSCMHELYRHLIPLGFMTQGDAFVSRSMYEERYYKEITREYSKIFFCYGSKAIQYSKYPKLSRLIARKLWNIKRGDNVVLYAPTKFHGKTIRPYKTYTDIQYWDYQKKLAQDVFPVIDKHVYIKKHKKGLLSSIDTRISPFSIIGTSNNVKLKEQPDLRFCRYSADIIMVDMATSTLSWALTSDTPVIFMHNTLFPLNEVVCNAAKKALFIIDVDDDLQWISDLRNLLNQPLTTIRQRWNAMEPEREIFLKEYITGPNASDDELYDWMIAQ